MQLKSLVASNVFLYKNFKLDFDNKVYLVLGKIDDSYDGSNGAGKSAIMDIILTGLYGKTLRRGITDISTDHKGGMNITTEFDNKKIIRNDRAVDLYVDGKQLSGLKKELQSFVSSTVDCDLFRLITIFTPKNNFFVLNDAEKKNLLISLTKNDCIDKVYDKVSDDLKALEQKNISILINDYERNLIGKDEIIAEFDEMEGTLSRYKVIEDGLIKYASYVQTRKAVLSNFETLEKDYKELQTKGRELKTATQDLKEIDLEATLTKMNEYQATINQNVTKITEAEKKLKMIAEEGTCPICRQHLQDKQRIIDDYIHDINDYRQQIKISDELYNKEKTNYTVLKKQKQENDELILDYKETKSKFDSTKEKYLKVKQQLEELDTLNKEYIKYEKETVTIGQINALKMTYGQMQQRVNDIKDMVVKLEKLKEDKKKIDLQISDLTEIKKIFSKDGLKQFVIQRITDFLKEKINAMVVKIFDDMQIDINLDFTERRNMMDIDIKRRGETFNIEELSTGERRLVELIFQIALNDLFEAVNNDAVNLMIFDETFDALDKKNIAKIADVLKLLEAREKTILIISHNDNVKQYFKNLLIIEKKNGISSIRKETQ